MPAFGTPVKGSQQAVYPGDPPFAVFNAETVVAGERSIYVVPSQLFDRRITGLSFEFVFNANPGNFSFSIQGADTGLNASRYLTEGSGTVTQAGVTGPQADGTYISRVELSPWVAGFCTVLCNTPPSNANILVTVNVTVQ